MTTTEATARSAMKLALDALDEFCELGAIIRPLEVRDALREALAEQPAPVAKPHEQEPVAIVTSESGNPDVVMSWWHEPPLPVGTPLYTTPPAQRTWVGLAKSEITTSLPYSVTRDKGCFHAGVLWAEAKLKAKNSL